MVSSQAKTLLASLLLVVVVALMTITSLAGLAAAELDGTDSIDAQTTMDGNSIDSGSDSWTNVSSMPTPRNGHAVAVVDGMIYAMGGYDGSDRLSVVERYDPGSDSWTTVSSLSTARETSAATTADGVYAIGGYVASGPVSTVERFTTATEDPSVTPDGTETEFYNDTTQIDANATDLEVTINGTNGSDVFINYYRIDDNGTEVLESEDNILSAVASDQATTTYPVQTENTSAYRVVIHDNATGLSLTDVGPISVSPAEISGGGGSLFGGGESSQTTLFIIGVVVVGYVLIGRD
jgi:Uncharacterized protein conserved in bacteria